jgi:hypothetical protein
MLVLIGSGALKRYVNISREPKDIDLMGTYDEVMDFARTCGEIRECYPIQSGDKYIIKTDQDIIEAEIAWEGSLTEQLIGFIRNDPFTKHRYLIVPSIDVLYTLKMSHRYLKNSPHFLKTMRDIQVMRVAGAVIPNGLTDWYKARQKTTYSYEHPKLNTTKDVFFTGDGIQYVYDHDTIHLAMAHKDKPAYKFYQPEDSQVNVAKELFFRVPEEIRLLGVLEESYVLALERSQIPHPGVPAKKSFDMALMKVCTSITSGWFREYAWEHYDQVQTMYDEGYVTRFWMAVNAGIVNPYRE